MEPPRRARGPALSLLQDPNFRTIWLASISIEAARRLELLVLSLFVLLDTKSVFKLALVWVFNYLPRFLFSPWSGDIADRFNRRWILLTSQSINLLSAAFVLFLIVDDLLKPWHVFVIIAVQGFAWALEQPSRRTAVFDIVGPQRVVNALSMESIGNTSGRLAGPILGGILISLLGNQGAYGFGFMVHLLALGLLVRLTIPQHGSAASMGSVWSSLTAAIRYAVHSPTLRGLLYVTIVMNALVFPVQIFIPDIGTNHLHVGPALVGLLVAADAFGQIGGAGVMASMRSHGHHGRVFTAGSLIVLASVVLFVWSPWYTLSFVLLAISGIGLACFGTMQSSITMLSAPPEMRGRMMGLLNVCIGIGSPLGALEIGIVAVAFSTQQAISANALGALLLLLPALALTPLVWRPSSNPSSPQ